MNNSIKYCIPRIWYKKTKAFAPTLLTFVSISLTIYSADFPRQPGPQVMDTGYSLSAVLKRLDSGTPADWQYGTRYCCCAFQGCSCCDSRNATCSVCCSTSRRAKHGGSEMPVARVNRVAENTELRNPSVSACRA